MSVAIASTPQPSTFWQRLTGTEPKTVVREVSTTEITNDPGGSFNIKTALRNGGIGAAVAGALGGVSLLAKVALPIIGKVGSVAGLAKLAGVGGAIGIATAALPLVSSRASQSPAVKAALTGAGIGAAAGAILPLLPIPIGAAIGAGVGLLIHHKRTHPEQHHSQYPGYRAYPGYVPAGTSPGDAVPNGFVPVSPNYGMYGQSAMNPYATGMPGYAAPGYTPGGSWGSPYGAQAGLGYGASPYGMMLPATAGQVQQPGVGPAVGPVAPVAARPAARPARRPAVKGAARPKAKTFTDKLGNVRQVGTGKIIKPTTRAAAPAATMPVGSIAPSSLEAAQAAAYGQAAQAAGYGQAADYGQAAGYGLPAGYGQMTTPSSMLPSGLQQAMSGISSVPAGTAAPVAVGMQPSAIPTRPVA